MSKWVRERKTSKIIRIVKSAVEQMPENATNIRLIEGHRHSVGAFGTPHCWTEVEAVYKDDDGHEVGRVRTIDKVGGWKYTHPANYVLYCMGLYVPYSEKNLRELKQHYECDLNDGFIYPINEIYSNEYLMDLKVKEAIFTTDKVNLTFKLDYNSDIWGSKWTKPCDYRIILDDFETEPLSEHDAYFLFTDTFDKLIENGIAVETHFEMKDEHKKRLDHWRWRKEINF